MKLNTEYIRRVYSFYSPFYDLIFGKIMEQGRKKAISLLDGGRNRKFLEVGVGTGLTIGLYPKKSNIIGIDISERMLSRARKNALKSQNGHNVTFQVMDALDLEFEDDTFDAVIASYVITTVTDPLKACLEMKRVCKRGGQIIVVNHSRSTNRFLSKLEEMISPLCWKIGFALDQNPISNS